MVYYLIVFVVLLAAELLYFRIADRFNIIDKPNERSSHTRITLRGGGIVFYLGALAFFVTNGFAYPWFMLGLTLIAGISFADDVHSVPNRVRLVFHFTAMLLLFYEWGLSGGFPWWYVLVALVFCTGVINAYNFMDGINGITGGYSLVVLFFLIYVNHFVARFVEMPFLYIAFLSVLVFNFFNFRTKAKCFAGDVGAVSMAFILLFALGKLILETGDWTYLLFLAVYGVDSILTIVHRLLLRENIFKAHRRHAYQVMANELKIPHVVVSSIYALLQAIVASGYFFFPTHHSLYFILTILFLSVAYLAFKFRFARK